MIEARYLYLKQKKTSAIARANPGLRLISLL